MPFPEHLLISFVWKYFDFNVKFILFLLAIVEQFCWNTSESIADTYGKEISKFPFRLRLSNHCIVIWFPIAND